MFYVSTRADFCQEPMNMKYIIMGILMTNELSSEAHSDKELIIDGVP
jgi:hypothetical protein